MWQDLISAIKLNLERMETADNTLFERLAALLNASREEIVAAQRHDNASAINSEMRGAITSILDTSTRILSQLNRLSAEHLKLQSQLKKGTAGIDDWSRFSTEIASKLTAIEVRLGGLGNSATLANKSASSRSGDAARVTGDVAKDLESILAELRDIAN